MTLAEAYHPIRPQLALVEAEMRKQIPDKLAVLAQGKRLRPGLLLLAARPGGQEAERAAVVSAAALEMVHTASLVHDDVIDDTPERRDKPALYRVMGIRPAVVFADLLFVQGLTSLDDVQPAAVLPRVVRAVRRMCEGQLQEMTDPRRPDFNERDYLEIIDKKTAALFACACHVGGLVRGAAEQELGDLVRFGRLFGFAYQLMDDAADLDGEDAGTLERWLAEWGGADYCRRTASSYATEAREVAGRLPDVGMREGFEKILEVIMEV
jgi:geranylgeranyl pyrophosphate synthase